MLTVFNPKECLVEGVGASSPPGEEQAEADGLEHSAHGADGNGIKGPLLGEDLTDELFMACKRLVNEVKQEKSACRENIHQERS